MAVKDLKKMSLAELKAHRKAVDAAITSFVDRKRAEARKEMEAVAKKHGLSVSEVMGTKSKRKSGKPVAPKYKNPDDASQTWSGRGRQPIWFKKAMENGATPESLSV